MRRTTDLHPVSYRFTVNQTPNVRIRDCQNMMFKSFKMHHNNWFLNQGSPLRKLQQNPSWNVDTNEIFFLFFFFLMHTE